MKIVTVTTSSLLLSLFVDQVTSQDDIPCNPMGSFEIAGAASVERLANAWIEEYQTECATSVSDASAVADRISVEGGGSSLGASRACGTSTSDRPVDIGGMSRSLNSGEASTDNDWKYQCERSTRELIKVRCLLLCVCFSLCKVKEKSMPLNFSFFWNWDPCIDRFK